MNRLALVVAIATAIAVVLKVLLLYRAFVFYDMYISDEFYYVPASNLLISRILGLNYTPPYVIEVVNVNGTPTISISVVEQLPVLHIPLLDWRNLEHPGFAKLVYGLIYNLAGGLHGLRLTLLVASAVAYGVFAYAVTSRYRLKGVAGVAVFLLVDKLAIHYTYLVFLDTLMMLLLLVAYTMYVLGKMKLSVAFLSLSAMCKVPGLVPALAFTVAEYRRSRSVAKALPFIVAPAVSLALSYCINLVFASPSEITRAVLGAATVKEYACSTPLCLFTLEEPWGILVLTPPLLWLWLAILVVKVLAGEREIVNEENLALSIALLNMLFTVTVSASRAIYVFYYLPAVSLTPVAVATLIEYLYRLRQKRFIGRLGCTLKVRA